MSKEKDVVGERLHESALVLSNAAELASAVIKRVAGNDISNSINGSKVSRDLVQNLLLRDMTKTIRQSTAS